MDTKMVWSTSSRDNVKILISILALLGTGWGVIYSAVNNHRTWLYVTGTGAILLLVYIVVSVLYRWFKAKSERQEAQIDLIKGILHTYVIKLNHTMYNDANLRARTQAQDLPGSLKELMNQKWYDKKTPAEIDAAIREFLGQIGYSFNGE